MRSFIKKLHICLFEPRKLGLFFGERLIKSFLQILLFSLIAISPYIITLSLSNDLSDSSYDILEEKFIENTANTTYKLENGEFSGEVGAAFLINEAIIFMNPLNEELELSVDYVAYHVIEFNQKGVVVSFLNNEVSSKTYEELGCTNIDFSEIEEANYLEFNKLVSLINKSFSTFHTTWVVINGLIILLDIYLTILISALVLSFVVKLINPIIGFKYRYKGALDAQFISLVFILLMFLFKNEIFRYIGIIFSAVYLFKGMIAIIRIEVKKNVFSDKDGE